MTTNHSNSPPHDERSADARARLCPTGPDLLELAAYIDGTVSDQARQGIESHLPGCDACREAVEDARQERDAGSMLFVPPAVIEAAVALVPADSAAIRRLHPLWITIVRRGVAVAALVAICFAGHSVGTLISGTTTDSSDSLGVAMSFGLTDSSDQSADDGELFAMPLSEASS